ncbi:MAG: hypothetical protein IPI49_29890 [Myxococcales bacterium]|nr:hypothetical protein [Myxococcales bacterium]
MGDLRYELTWHVSFRFPFPAQRDTWYAGPDGAAALVGRLAETALWPLFDVIGSAHELGEPLDHSQAGCAAIARQAAAGHRVITLARGDARAAMFVDESELAARLTVRSDALELQLGASGDALQRLGPTFLDEGIDLVADFYHRQRGQVQLAHAVAVPSGLRYPRPRPPRGARRFVAAVVDILAPHAPRGPIEPRPGFDFVGEAQRLAAAPLPACAERQPRGELLIDRWVADPRDLAAVGRAAGLHERWLAQLVDTTVASGWNERGAQRVALTRAAPHPPFRLVDSATGVAYLDLDEHAAEDDARWQLAAAPPAGIERVRLVAASHHAALALRPLAQQRGLSGVLYADGQTLWDPAPPGDWLPDEAPPVSPTSPASPDPADPPASRPGS